MVRSKSGLLFQAMVTHSKVILLTKGPRASASRQVTLLNYISDRLEGSVKFRFSRCSSLVMVLREC